MKLPPSEPDTAHLGPWIGVDDVKSVIRSEALRYYRRYKEHFVGDEDDLSQSAELSLWEWSLSRGHPERIRELEAFALVSRSMITEIKGTERLRHNDTAQGEIDWSLVTAVRPTLTPTQLTLLGNFQHRCSQLAKRYYWECLWLVRGCEWEPIDVTRWFRVKRDDKHRFTPDAVTKMVKKAEDRIRKKLNPIYVDEINQINFCWW